MNYKTILFGNQQSQPNFYINRVSTWLFFVILSTSLPFATPRAAAATRPQAAARAVESFDIAAAPQNADWKYFLNAPESFRQSLWQYNTQRGKALKDWAWQWRLGWLRACSESVVPYCMRIFEAALADRAVVVRADAATRLGRRYDGSGNSWATEILIRAAQNPRNSRHGNPLYIQQRILFALKTIGGSRATAEAGRIARIHKGSAAYWDKLNRG